MSVGTIIIPKPSDEVVEKFRKVMEAGDGAEYDKYLLSGDHCSALITEEMGLDEVKSCFDHDERFYAGFWRFDGRFVRRKRHNGVNVGVKADGHTYVFEAGKLANLLKVAGREVNLYICRKEGGWGFLLVLNDRCGLALAPVVDEEGYVEIERFARLIEAPTTDSFVKARSFFEELSDGEAERLVERLSVELGIALT